MERDRTPFLAKDRLEHRGMFTEIDTLENDPNYLAKTYILDFEQFHDGEPPHTYDERVQQFLQEARLIQEYYADSIPEFHIAMREAQWDQSGKTGTPIVFMKKVEGMQERNEHDDRKYLQGLDEIFAKEIELFTHTFDGKSGLVPEIFKTNNYIYGTIDTDESPNLYFIDLYPIYHWTPQSLLEQIEQRMAFEKEDQFPKTKAKLHKITSLIE